MDKVKKNVLVYTRRRLDKFFHNVVEHTFSGEITYFSDWPGLEQINIMNQFYHYYYESIAEHPFSDYDLEQIILRCPLLSKLPRDKAELMVAAMYKAINKLVLDVKPDILLSVIVDNYLTDILYRICKHHGIITIGICNGLKNTILVTGYGEFNKVRDPEENEVYSVLAELSDDNKRVNYGLKVNGNQYSLTKHSAKYFRLLAKAVIFQLMKYYHKDPLNYRLLVGTRNHGHGPIPFFNYRCVKYYNNDWAQRVKKSKLPAIFIPLAHIPEASTCYWLKDIRCIDYEKYLVNVCITLSKHYLIVIKDHWSMLGIRNWEFYRNLSQIPGVVIVPTNVNSRDVMKLVERVLVEVGTAGVEAAIRGKKVVTIGKPYFYLEKHYLSINSAEDIERLSEKLEAYTPPINNTDTQYRIIQKFLESSLEGSILLDNRLDQEENILKVSKGLSKYITKQKL